jgi:hypothetical protein
MSTTPYEMPFRGTDCAPKFDGTLDMLAEFIDAYEECADRAGLQGLDKIKGIIKSLEREDRELCKRDQSDVSGMGWEKAIHACGLTSAHAQIRAKAYVFRPGAKRLPTRV